MTKDYPQKTGDRPGNIRSPPRLGKEVSMRISRVYTRTGDGGKTRLAGGEEIWKDALRVEAYGTVDELNAVIGLARVFNQDNPESEGRQRIDRLLMDIQQKLFDLGAVLATTPGAVFANMPAVTKDDVQVLEAAIDTCQEDLQPLKEFILPGGGKVSGFLHQARTVCRRAERVCVKLSHEEAVDPQSIVYLNRLSDALFVFARWIGKIHGEREFLWDRKKSP